MSSIKAILLAVAAVLTGLAILLAVLSVRKRRRLKRKLSVARQHLQSGDLLSALRAYVEADSDWADMAEIVDNSRVTFLRDIKLLDSIWTEIDGASSEANVAIDVSEISRTIARLNKIYSDRKNFGIDGVTLKAGPAKDNFSLRDQLDASRAQARTQIAAIVNPRAAATEDRLGLS